MRPIALVITFLVLGLQFFVRGDHNNADSDLQFFYTEILSANFSAARHSIDEAIRLWPTNGRYYGWRAYCTSQYLPSQCHTALNSHRAGLTATDQEAAYEAIADYRKDLELNNRDAVAHHNLAWLEHLLGDDRAAAADWSKAIETDPDDAVFHVSYGMFLDETGATDRAKQQYETAIHLSPAVLDSQFFERYRRRNPQAASSIVKHCSASVAAKLGPSRNPLLEAKLGKYYLYLGDTNLSASLLQDAAERLPNLPLVWLNLGEVREGQGDVTAAMICYKKANVIDGSLPEPYLRMGLIGIQNGDKPDADHDLRMAIVRWKRVNPVTAAHNNRLYVGPLQTIDDLLPTTLVWYVTPCQASAAWRGLSQLFPQNEEYASRINTCENLPSPHADITYK